MSTAEGIARAAIPCLIDLAAAYLVVAVAFVLFGLSQGIEPALAVRTSAIILPTTLLLGVTMPFFGLQNNWLAIVMVLPIVALGVICWMAFRYVRNRALRILALAAPMTAYAFGTIYVVAQII